MRRTSFTDFSLRLLAVLAGDPARSFTTNETARSFGISRDEGRRRTCEAGFVSTRRGAAGGFLLARSPEEIRLGEVVRVLEAGLPLMECFWADGGACRLMPGCMLRPRLAAAWAAFTDELDKSILAQCAAPMPAPAP